MDSSASTFLLAIALAYFLHFEKYCLYIPMVSVMCVSVSNVSDMMLFPGEEILVVTALF